MEIKPHSKVIRASMSAYPFAAPSLYEWRFDINALLTIPQCIWEGSKLGVCCSAITVWYMILWVPLDWLWVVLHSIYEIAFLEECVAWKGVRNEVHAYYSTHLCFSLPKPVQGWCKLPPPLYVFASLYFAAREQPTRVISFSNWLDSASMTYRSFLVLQKRLVVSLNRSIQIAHLSFSVSDALIRSKMQSVNKLSLKDSGNRYTGQSIWGHSAVLCRPR